MTSAVTKPRVFISSTVRDFADLRGALKHWLVQAGYDVQMSELTDFDRRPEAGTFESCFDNVARSDFYILLIGAARGSWYDEEAKVSVTQAEFRCATKVIQQQGTCKPFLFVRRSVAGALSQWRADGEPAPNGRDGPVQDPAFTSSFITEVEAFEATSGKLWLYRFDNFADIIAALRAPLALNTDINRRLIEANLYSELLQNLSGLISRRKEGFASVDTAWTGFKRSSIQVSSDASIGGDIELTSAQIRGIGMISLLRRGGQRLQSVALEEATRSGLFRKLNVESGLLEPTIAYYAAQLLLDDIESVRSYFRNPDYNATESRLTSVVASVNKTKSKEPVRVMTWDLIQALAVHDLMDNIFRGSTQFAHWLNRDEESPEIARNPQSPIEGESEKLAEELISPSEVDLALRNRWIPFGQRPHPDDQKFVEQVDEHMVESVMATAETMFADNPLTEEQKEKFRHTAEEALRSIRTSGRMPKLETTPE